MNAGFSRKEKLTEKLTGDNSYAAARRHRAKLIDEVKEMFGLLKKQTAEEKLKKLKIELEGLKQREEEVERKCSATDGGNRNAWSRKLKEARQATKELETEILNLQGDTSFLVRNPKDGTTMHCSEAVAENLLRSGKGYRVLSSPPPIDIKSIISEVLR